MWYLNLGPSGDTVLSSRVRLARNINKIPFGKKITDHTYEYIEKECKKALPDLKFIDLSLMPDTEKLALKECHLISPEIAASQHRCSILVNTDCTVSVMLGEEDHIRIQSMCPGFDLKACLDKANEIDDRLEEKIDFAFSEKFGYLTCCPTNTGTGLRASVMMHLPALSYLGSMESIIRSLSKLGIVVRGIYGEGSLALANIYQISNQVTLGMSEKDSIEKLENIVNDLVEKERAANSSLMTKMPFQLEDKVMRAKGILKNARIITSTEALNLISDVRWGINLGIIKDITHEKLLSAFYFSLPANIEKKFNTVTPMERDLKRSEIFKEYLN